MKFCVSWLLLLLCLHSCRSPLKEDRDLLCNMMSRAEDQFGYYLERQDSLEIQIIYTQINRDSINQPQFKSFYFRVDSTHYFYPASTVKLPMVMLSLEKLNQLRVKGLTKFTPVYHDSVYSGQRSVKEDTTTPDCYPTIAHYAKKILITSDNDAHNRLYEFVGQGKANRAMAEKGYAFRLLHRLDRALTPDENRHTEPVRFVDHNWLVYRQDMQVNDSIVVNGSACKGIGYLQDNQYVEGSFDFSYKNFFPLAAQQRVLRAILFPATVKHSERFDLTDDDRALVLRYMSQLPTETRFPAYYLDTAYYPAYAKFLMFGNSRKPIPESIRIFNKIGDAYGFLIDNAYVVDFDNHVEFMLSAVIHVNHDGVYNDNQYDYESVGFPFMERLGQLVYDYELNRERKYLPDLEAFRFEYSELIHP